MAAKRTALVTGASYGVGAATALALARDGFDLAVTATKIENLAATMKTLAGRAPAWCRWRSICATRQASRREAAEIIAALGRARSAGQQCRRESAQGRGRGHRGAEWDAVMAVNVRGAFFLTQQVGRHHVGRPGRVHHQHRLDLRAVGAPSARPMASPRRRLVGMTRMLAVEWAGSNIRVNAIAPGRLDHAVAVARRQGSGSRPIWRQCSSASRCAGRQASRRWRRRSLISRAPPPLR